MNDDIEKEIREAQAELIKDENRAGNGSGPGSDELFEYVNKSRRRLSAAIHARIESGYTAQV
ncbi:MAG: hypothetical protein MIO92_12780 [Methanosarcinaceae archaeon]|nr:hypothetical protein [Methanosarcinaceae archaeon]